VDSRSHCVAIGQELKDVKQFGVCAQDLRDLPKWLRQNNINSVAME